MLAYMFFFLLQSSRSSNIHVDPKRVSSVLPPLLQQSSPSASTATTVAPSSAKEAKPFSSRESNKNSHKNVSANKEQSSGNSASSSEVTNRDPRVKNEVKTKSSNQIIEKATSRDPRSSSLQSTKARSLSNKVSRLRDEKPSDREQLFKPDPVTKIQQQKIKIELNNDSSKLKSSSAPASRDPRMKSRDPRIKEQKKESSTIVATDAKKDISAPKESKSAKEKPQPEEKSVKTSNEEIIQKVKKELKKIEKTKDDKKHSSRSPGKESSSSPKHRESSSSRSRDKKKIDSKPKDRDNRQSEKTHSSESSSNIAKSFGSSQPASSSSSISGTAHESYSPSRVNPESSTSQDSFRSLDRSNYRKRNLRQRTTPSPEDIGSQPAEKEPTEAPEVSKEEPTDSDESDHYEANKPKQAFADKKISGDTDLRLLTAQAKKPGQIDPPKEKAKVDAFGLFGSEDVDLRMFGGSKDQTSLPSAFQGRPQDQDLRNVTNVAMGDVQSSVEAGVSDIKENPTNWDKFRERNPQFKEYQRQTSNLSLADSPQVPAEAAKIRAEIRRRIFDDEDSNVFNSSEASSESDAQKDGLKVSN